MQLPFPVTVVANAAINGVIRKNAEALQLLAASDGGVVALELRNPSVSIRVAILCNGIELLSDFDAEPELELSADVPALMALADSAHDALLDGRVQAEGDMELARLVQQLLVVLTSDWEEQLSPFMGDALAHKVGTASRGLSAWISQTRERGAEDVGEYLQEEARVLVTQSEWRELEQEADQLRERVDRLTVRMQRAES